MNFEEYWAALVAKNPLLKSEERLTVSVGKLKAMLQQSHEHGFEHGKAVSDFLSELLGAKR